MCLDLDDADDGVMDLDDFIRKCYALRFAPPYDLVELKIPVLSCHYRGTFHSKFKIPIILFLE